MLQEMVEIFGNYRPEWCWKISVATYKYLSWFLETFFWFTKYYYLWYNFYYYTEKNLLEVWFSPKKGFSES